MKIRKKKLIRNNILVYLCKEKQSVTMSDINQNITILRSLVEEAADHRIATSSDFAFLAGCIQGRIRQSISVSTLERIWGYVEGYQTVRTSTLSILAQFVGYPDWQTFVMDYCETPSAHSSRRITSALLSSDEVAVGEKVVIEWNPGRRCVLRHLGDGRWIVEESERSKLMVNDTFRCYRFILNQPLYLEDFKHGDEPASLFLVGNRGGLTKAARLTAQ